MAETRNFFATTAKAMEGLLAQELRGLGIPSLKEERAGVSFEGTLEQAYRVCLWSRIANRVLLPLKRFPAPTPEKLYGGVKSIRWSDHLTPRNTLAVDFSSSHSQITHTHFGALKVKDAICDQFRSVQGSRPSVDPARPDIRVNVYLQQDEATVSLDLSGESLHLRGYREAGALAPLKENLASAILMHAGWPEKLREAREKGEPLPAFLDPMCGSGTLPIEAGLIAANVAPGSQRRYFGFQGWQGHVPAIWKRLLQEAEELRVRDRKKLPRIVGYDQDFRAVRLALGNLERSGLLGLVHLEKREFSVCEAIEPKGVIVLNPPYGERLGDVEELKPLYKQIGDTFKQKFRGWEGYVFTGSPELAKVIGLKAARRIVLFNGAIECRLFKYELY
ncbi:MAG: THUMP domain-containing protein [Oligoflexia bacterium]|nr:THUMP domain-containing protein [Oligoflexia bacterium]